MSSFVNDVSAVCRLSVSWLSSVTHELWLNGKS